MTNNSKDVIREPIALIGIACEYAGGINSPKALWDALVQCTDLGGDVPKGRFDLESFMVDSLDMDKEKRFVNRGYFLSNKLIEEFDPSFFGISDGEALTIDPCHRILLEKFMHLLDDAGYTADSVAKSNTSVYIGQYTLDHHINVYRQNFECRPATIGPQLGTYNASARISYHYDLHGPNFTLDTACSSSLQAVQLAVQSLRLGEADLAVAGGTNLCYTPETFAMASQLPIVSPKGQSKSFSSDGDGYAKAEGIALVLLKRLTDAEKDGDKIYCVIREVMSNHDGKTNKSAYVVPSAAGQGALLTQIYQTSQTDPKSVFYVECHGTGTQIGDPVEANTIGAFFHRSPYEPPLLIGSVKSVIGHTEGTSGVSALIKAALCAYKGAVTPNMHFQQINPRIKIDEHNMHVITRITPLPSPQNSLSFIGINSFGMGGNNCHAIIHAYASEFVKNGLCDESGEDNHQLALQLTQHESTSTLSNNGKFSILDQSKQAFVITLTARSKASLNYQVDALRQWLNKLFPNKEMINIHSSAFLIALTQTLLLKRTVSFDHRVSFIISNMDQLHYELDNFLSSGLSMKRVVSQRKEDASHSICFVFSGQGPQWWAMGRQLYESEHVFRTWIDRVDRELRLLTEHWSLIDELFSPSNETESRINETNIAQPALFAIQVALAGLWISWGIRPSVIVGHSLGELAATYVAGRLTLRAAVGIVYHRARLQHRNTRQNGRMLAINISEEEARDLIQDVEDKINIAAINSAQYVTLSGDADILNNIDEIATSLHPQCNRSWVRVENAFHSYQMTRHDIEKCLKESLQNVLSQPLDLDEIFDIHCSQAQLYSTVTGTRIESNSIHQNPDYWWQNVRQPVLFYQAIKAILHDHQEKPIQTFIEISPHPVLASALTDTIGPSAAIVPSLKRKHDEQDCMLAGVCHLFDSTDQWKRWLNTRSYSKGPINGQIDQLLWDLPLYQFNHSVLWYETKDSVLTRRAISSTQHPLLGSRVWTKPFGLWINTISLSSSHLSYLRDHRVQDKVLYPAAGFIEMILTAARELIANSSKTSILEIMLHRIELLKALVINDDEPIEMHTLILLPSYDFFIYSRKSQRNDYTRKCGIASDDLVISYTNKQVLEEYRTRDWTLHMQGSINLNVDPTLELSRSQKMSEIYAQVDTNVCWSIENRMARHQLYKLLNSRGYQYGPHFQCIQTAHGTQSAVVAQLSSTNKAEYYSFPPILLDGCLQSPLVLLPSEHTFVPVCIEKITFLATELDFTSKEYCRVVASYRPVVRGLIDGDNSYTMDVWMINPHNNDTCSIHFQGVKLQSIASSVDETNATTSIFDRLEKFAWFPFLHKDPRDFQKLIDHYCFSPVWIETTMQMNSGRPVKILPTPSDIMGLTLTTTTSMKRTIADIIQNGRTEADRMAMESYDEFSQWIANIVIVTFKQLCDNNQIDQNTIYERSIAKHHRLVNALFALTTDRQDLDQINQFSLRVTQAQLAHKYPKLISIISLIGSCARHLAFFITGVEDPLQWLFGLENEKYLQDYYSTMSETYTRAPFEAILTYLHDAPSISLKILEIGAGTGGSTIHILELLLDFANTTSTHIEFVFTDISPSFFASARTRFDTLLKAKNHRGLMNIIYQVLNLDDEPVTFIESFDIVFASNVVHATQNIVHSLEHIRHLLCPGGLVILVEICKPLTYLDLIFGLLSQWWVQEKTDDKARVGEIRAIVNLATWQKAFELATGFDHMAASTSEIGLSTIIAKKTKDTKQIYLLPERKRKVWIIFCGQNSDIVIDIAKLLKDDYYQSEIVFISCGINSSIRDNHIVLDIENLPNAIRDLFKHMSEQYSQINTLFAVALDLQLSSLNNDDHESCYEILESICLALLYTVQALQLVRKDTACPNLVILTSNAQPTTCNAYCNFLQGPFIGFGRSLLHEYDHGHLKLIDIQTQQKASLGLLKVIAAELISQEISNDNEIAFIETSAGQIQRHILRYSSINKNEKDMHKSIDHSFQIQPEKDFDINPFALEIPASGFLTDLNWVSVAQQHRKERLLPTQVQIRVHCVGLIFRDLLQVQGLYPRSYSFPYNDDEEDRVVGLEFSGTVIQLGSEAAVNYNIGDRVFGFTTKLGAFTSHLILDALNICRAPNGFSMEQLASLPVAFFTVLLALKERIQLRANQTCLIHSASGAVGLAAIQYCRLVGAHVIATAGTAEKRRFLREKVGIEHVFDSRNLSFVNDVRRIVKDGVDVIINSLSGVFLQQSMTLLAPNGHFIELGKRDLYNHSSLPMFEFRQECSWHVIDAVHHHNRYPHKTQELFSFLCEHLKLGSLQPIEPLLVFEPEQIVEAFQLYKRATSFGKFIIRVTHSQQSLTLKSPQNKIIEQLSMCSRE